MRRSPRRWLYEQLEPTARPQGGLSLLNRILVALIFCAAAFAIVDTEPLASTGRETIFRGAELAFGLAFLAEYAGRLWIAVENPKYDQARFPRLRYAMTPAALVDLAAILPALLAFSAGGTLLLRFFRVLRLIRLAKLGRMSRAWLHVVEAVHSRRFELGLTVCLGAMAMLLSATALYWAEGEAQPDKFGSIPRSLWWAVVTLTTVGYGDVFPITPAGKFLSAVVAIVGIGLIALPTGILAAAFSDAIQRQREEERDRRGN